MMIVRLSVYRLLLLALVSSFAAQALAADEVATLIDQQLEKQWTRQGITPAAATDDRAFVRRVYLDLAGRIPTLAELQAFLADARPDKRAAIIDQLIGSSDYARHMREQFDVMLMG